MKLARRLGIPSLEFWNLACMCVVGYGAVILLSAAYFGFDRLLPELSGVDTTGFAIFVLSSGSVGLFSFHELFTQRGWWHEAFVFAYSLNFVVAIAAVGAGYPRLLPVIAEIVAVEWAINHFVIKREAQ